MIKEIFGASIGAKLSERTSRIGGKTGAALGAAVPFIVSRAGLPAMVALGVGGYVVSRLVTKKPIAPQFARRKAR